MVHADSQWLSAVDSVVRQCQHWYTATEERRRTEHSSAVTEAVAAASSAANAAADSRWGAEVCVCDCQSWDPLPPFLFLTARRLFGTSCGVVDHMLHCELLPCCVAAAVDGTEGAYCGCGARCDEQGCSRPAGDSGPPEQRAPGGDAEVCVWGCWVCGCCVCGCCVREPRCSGVCVTRFSVVLGLGDTALPVGLCLLAVACCLHPLCSSDVPPSLCRLTSQRDADAAASQEALAAANSQVGGWAVMPAFAPLGCSVNR